MPSVLYAQTRQQRTTCSISVCRTPSFKWRVPTAPLLLLPMMVVAIIALRVPAMRRLSWPWDFIKCLRHTGGRATAVLMFGMFMLWYRGRPQLVLDTLQTPRCKTNPLPRQLPWGLASATTCALVRLLPYQRCAAVGVIVSAASGKWSDGKHRLFAHMSPRG